MGVLLDFAVMVMFGWVPERPRWATWVVAAVYVVVFAAAIAFAFAELL
jgi:hypothetical protein